MIFGKSLPRIDENNTKDAIIKLADHIRYTQEQLEYILSNLDSQNIIEIDTDKTPVRDSAQGSSTGTSFYAKGANGESFFAGTNSKGKFEFTLKANGKTIMHLDDNGNLIIDQGGQTDG